MRCIKLTLALGVISQLVCAQTYTSWSIGDSTDVITNHQSAVVLAGGGGDHDGAMRWLLRKADGGDVVVIRASGADGYNPYFYDELGVRVNSVTTIRFDSASAAFDSQVINTLRGAEVLFIAGGDQTVYHHYWHSTPVQETLNYLINEKKIAIGGTSAGMAILGQYAYLPEALGVTAEEALSNPYHPYMERISTGGFLNIPYLEGVITDTHFDQRDRAGRTVAFLARLVGDGHLPRAITANEYTAIAIDKDGLAWVFGDYPAYDDYVYFIQTSCDAQDIVPEHLQSDAPLQWHLDERALKVYRIGGTSDGSRYFDLNNWQEGRGGSWQDWWVDRGMLSTRAEAAPPCIVAGLKDRAQSRVRYYDSETLEVISDRHIQHLTILQSNGKVVLRQRLQKVGTVRLPSASLPTGLLILQMTLADGSVQSLKVFCP